MKTPTLSLPALLILFIGVLVFAPGLTGAFIFDDYPNLLLDDSWKVSSNKPEVWFNAIANGISSPAGRPLALLSFATNHYFTGLSPFYLKLGNLFLHLINGLLVWTLLRRLFHHPVIARRLALGFLNWAPLLMAVSWLVHPLQVSTVLYVVQRMEIGAATGILLALLFYVSARFRQQAGRRGWPWLLLAGVSTGIGLGFKETAILAPVLALLIEACFFRFRDTDGRFAGWLAGAFIAGGVLALIGYIRVILPFVVTPEETLYAIRSFGPWERLLSQGPVLALYLKQILLPLPESMTFYYDNFPVSTGFLQPPATLLSFLLLAALGVAAIVLRKHWPLTTLGIGWYFACHILTSNVVPLELAFEHRNYLALLGIVVGLAQPLSTLLAKLHADARLTLAAVPILGLAVLCSLQAATWGNPMRLHWTLENRNPDSPRASYALGRALLDQSDNDPDSVQMGLARNLFRHASSLPQASPLAAQGLILIDARHGRSVAPETWNLLRNSLTRTLLGPEALSALYAVSNCRIQGRCQFDDAQLLNTFLTVLEHNPDSGAAHTLYANFAWNVLGDQPLAVSMQREAVRLGPNQTGYQIALAKFLLASSSEEYRQEGTAVLADLEQRGAEHRFKGDMAELRRLRSNTSAAKASDSLIP